MIPCASVRAIARGLAVNGTRRGAGIVKKLPFKVRGRCWLPLKKATGAKLEEMLERRRARRKLRR